jgi:DNA repair ATPase RecN
MEKYDYEKALIDELARLNSQKQEIMNQIHEVETKLDVIKGKKAAALYNEIRNKIQELENLDYRFEVQFWDNSQEAYDWYDMADGNAFRYRHKDTVIVD